jgi:hypothetical protein
MPPFPFRRHAEVSAANDTHISRFAKNDSITPAHRIYGVDSIAKGTSRRAMLRFRQGFGRMVVESRQSALITWVFARLPIV